MPDIQGRQHQQRRNDRAGQMVDEYPHVSRAGRAASTNSRWRREIVRLRTIRIPRPVRQGDGDNYVGQPGSQYPTIKEREIEVGRS